MSVVGRCWFEAGMCPRRQRPVLRPGVRGRIRYHRNRETQQQHLWQLPQGENCKSTAEEQSCLKLIDQGAGERGWVAVIASGRRWLERGKGWEAVACASGKPSSGARKIGALWQQRWDQGKTALSGGRRDICGLWGPWEAWAPWKNHPWADHCGIWMKTAIIASSQKRWERGQKGGSGIKWRILMAAIKRTVKSQSSSTWMDLERPTWENKLDREDKYHMISLMVTLKKWYKGINLQTEIDSQRKESLWLPKGKLRDKWRKLGLADAHYCV